jgi:hypothetical protein
MKSFIAIVLIALAMTAGACCLAGVAFWMGVANPNVLADHPWPNNTLTGWWCCFTGSIFTAVIGAYALVATASITGRWLGEKISQI